MAKTINPEGVPATSGERKALTLNRVLRNKTDGMRGARKRGQADVRTAIEVVIGFAALLQNPPVPLSSQRKTDLPLLHNQNSGKSAIPEIL